MNETPVFHLDGNWTLHRKTLTHIFHAGVKFFNTTALTGIVPSAKAASQFILAEVSSSSFLLAFASSRFDVSCFFSLMNLSHGLSNLRLPARRNVLVFSLYFFSVLDTRLFESDVETFFSCRRFQIWFGALFVTAVLTLFDASLLFALKRSYRKLMFKTGLLWPLDFRVDSERK